MEGKGIELNKKESVINPYGDNISPLYLQKKNYGSALNIRIAPEEPRYLSSDYFHA